ncbi:MAG: acetate kinase [Hyphomicrobiales bacterium]|nr:acetate kinase [Hyphomicrobiales bacterium]
MSWSARLVLVVNSGSSSLKFTVLPCDGGEALVSGLAERLGSPEARLVLKRNGDKTVVDVPDADHSVALYRIFAHLDGDGLLDRIGAVGHRVVHGGERFSESVRLDEAVIADIEAVSALAPLHNPANLVGIRACLAALPEVPQIAVFDTAFHQTMPPAAWAYAVPDAWRRDHGVRRYGFHGTSHRHVSAEAARVLGLPAEDHGLVVAHLGNGASATAILNGRSVDTTMGLTPLEGLVMGTRSGDIDVGVVTHVAAVTGKSLAEIETILNKESGLLGLSGLSNDCRTLEAAAAEGHAGAELALEVFVHRLARHIGGLATSLPRLDALVFTGGIGENSARIRAMTLARLRVFGFELDAEANAATFGGRLGRISRGAGPVALVVPTDEEGLIARDAVRLAGFSDGGDDALAAAQ